MLFYGAPSASECDAGHDRFRSPSVDPEPSTGVAWVTVID